MLGFFRVVGSGLALEIGLSMLYVLGEPFGRMVEEVSRCKVKCVEVVDDGFHVLNRERVAVLRGVGASFGVEFSVHAPFAGVNIAVQSRPLLNAMLRRLKQSIVNAAGLECDIWVFHPGLSTGLSMFYPGCDWSGNMEAVRLLFRLADDYGVKAVVENIMVPFVLTRVADFERFFDEVGCDVGMVLDTGHANLYGEVDLFLKSFPDTIVHMHAHDNFGKTDQHLGVGFGNVDWDNAAGLLKKSCYDGIVVVEAVEHVEESLDKLRGLLFG